MPVDTDAEARAARLMRGEVAAEILDALLQGQHIDLWALPVTLQEAIDRWEAFTSTPAPGVSGADDAGDGGLEGRRACWTCASAVSLTECSAECTEELSTWLKTNCGNAGAPLPTARNCPGYVARGGK